MVFLGNQRSKPTVAWMAPASGSLGGTPRGGSPGRQLSPRTSAQRGAHTERPNPPLAPTHGPAAPESASSRSAAMVSPFCAQGSVESEGHLSDASDKGLQVPEVVKQWVTSQRGMARQRSITPQGSNPVDGRAHGKEEPAQHEGEADLEEGQKFSSGNFADSVPLASFRGR